MAQRFRHTEMMELESPTESKHGLTTQEDHTPPSANNSNGKRRFTNIPHLGIIMAIASSFFFSLSSLIVKLVPDVHPVALATYRFAGILLPSIPIVIRRSEDPFPKGKRWLLLLRAFLGTTNLMSQFYALRHMPLADASVIIFSVPVFVAIFARIFLKVFTDSSSSFSFIYFLKFPFEFTGGMRTIPCGQYFPDIVRMHFDCSSSIPFR